MSTEQASELETQGHRLYADGQYSAAASAFTAAAELFRAQVDAGSVEAAVQYAGQLNNVALCMGKLQRYDDAIAHLEGAAAIAQRCLPAYPGLRPFYASVLQSLAGALADSGRADRAMEVTEQVVPLRRAATEPGPLQVDPELAKALRQYAQVRLVAGRELEGALPAATEAVTIYQALVDAGAAGFDVELYLAYDVLASVFDGLGRASDAGKVRAWLADKTY